MSQRIPPSVQHKLGFYVYLYVDPRDDSVFYVGKGKGGRALSHLKDRTESEKAERMQVLGSWPKAKRGSIRDGYLPRHRSRDL
jgi:hypothetical protein